MNTKEGYTMNDLASLSATKLLAALKNKQMGSLELLEFYIERYERLNPRINAIVATDFDSARKRAQEADAALAKGEVWGPFHGLPMTIKDNIPVKGMPNTYGMPDSQGLRTFCERGRCSIPFGRWGDYFRKNQSSLMGHGYPILQRCLWANQ